MTDTVYKRVEGRDGGKAYEAHRADKGIERGVSQNLGVGVENAEYLLREEDEHQ